MIKSQKAVKFTEEQVKNEYFDFYSKDTDWKELTKKYQRFHDDITGHPTSYSEIEKGQLISGTIIGISYSQILVEVDNKNTVVVDVQKDKTAKRIVESLEIGNPIDVYVSTKKLTGSLKGVRQEVVRQQLTECVKSNNHSFEAFVEEHIKGGFMVSIEGIMCFLPGSQAAPNKLMDTEAFQALVGTTVNVMSVLFDTQKDTFVVSHKKWIDHNLQSMMDNLKYNVPYCGKITGVMSFGCFIQFEEYFTALLHKTEMDENTFNSMLTLQAGEDIYFYVKEIKEETKNGRTEKKIFLTQKVQ